ncbi:MULTISPECIES: hypothetical protein [Thermococcaceae]|uniref:Uncharacterized protein n=2 Tax=Thermococcaceae TaxID=2259 RepID=A0A075LUX0_9EURY|nr:MULTISPECIES: hypothetical protein [Thermococcaceae]ACS90758.1 hypothetical protein TSIB_1707 [Thermococcus sibiricus MM 739]AIF70124.1 hypothetical protein PAP_08715 [Palaeococcus pacificus DY20341]MBC7094219.1 hypothetical protein [Thermococcus sp.]
MRKSLFFGVLLLFLLFLSYYFSLTPKEGDVFTGYLVEGKVLNVQKALVLADTDCIPNNDYTKLTCTAIINANGEILKVRYTHPIEVPCLSKGDNVNISMKNNSTVKIIRTSRPSMEH